jgi:hypothetical protein
MTFLQSTTASYFFNITTNVVNLENDALIYPCFCAWSNKSVMILPDVLIILFTVNIIILNCKDHVQNLQNHPFTSAETKCRSIKLIPVACVVKAWDCGCSHAGIVGLNSTGSMDACCFCVCVCCYKEISAMGWILMQNSPTECGESEFDCEASTLSRPGPLWVVMPWGKKNSCIICSVWIQKTYLKYPLHLIKIADEF